MTESGNGEEKVECPYCDREIVKRGLFMHIWQTDDSAGRRHDQRGTVPDDLELEDVEVSGTADVQMDYPDTQDLEDAEYFDTYTGKAYKGKRGLMVHLGQIAGENNIPEDVTDRFDADDFPVVETDEDGNITNVVKWGSNDVPPLEPYLPWHDDSSVGYVRKKKIKEVLEKYRNSEEQMTVASLEEKLLGEREQTI